MSKHTPGPWLTNSPDWVIANMGELGHCGVALVHNVDGSQEANARLIAAAPELLGALEEINQMLSGSLPITADVKKVARAAIAKATGAA